MHRISRSDVFDCKAHGMSSYRLAESEAVQNEHLQKSGRGATAANVILAANVYQQDELRGVKEVIRSFRALTKSTKKGR
jgi:hypothetical protein